MIDARYGTIKGLSERRRLPLLGKIRLGVKMKKNRPDSRCKHAADKACSFCTYPKETDYFVCPPEVRAIYGEKPTELDVMFPVATRHVIFPTAYRWYGVSKGIKCIGNGETAMRRDENTNRMMAQEIECPCALLRDCEDFDKEYIAEHGHPPKKECRQRAFLMAMLPKVSPGGVYQLSTGSYNSIIDINSGLDFVEALVGRCQMVPMKLKREKVETHHGGQKQTHHTLKVIFEGTVDFINVLRDNTKHILLTQQMALPAPRDENPETEKVEVVPADVADEEKSTPSSPAQTAPPPQESVSSISSKEESRAIQEKEKMQIEGMLRNEIVGWLAEMVGKDPEGKKFQ